MKKISFLLLVIVILASYITKPAINQGYYELDRVFGFQTTCDTPDCRSKKFKCGSDNCRWSRIFRILDRYHIDPNTYFFKTPERETLLDYAAREGNIKAMKTLFDKYRMNITDNALIAAIENNKQAALRLLLDKGAVPTIQVIDFAYNNNAQWAINMLARYGFTQ